MIIKKYTLQFEALALCSLPRTYKQLWPCQRYMARVYIFCSKDFVKSLKSVYQFCSLNSVYQHWVNAGRNIDHLQGRFELAMKPCPPQARLSWSTARADSLVTTTCTKIYFFFTTTCAKIFLFFRFEHLYLYRTGQCMKRRKIGKVALLKLSLSTILKLWNLLIHFQLYKPWKN